MSGSDDEEEEEAPPIPPRGKSLSPDTKSNTMMNTAGRELMNGNTTRPFLGKGRGDIRSPLSNKNGSSINTPTNNTLQRDDKDDKVVHLTTSQVEADEEALLSELNELENLYMENEQRNAKQPTIEQQETESVPTASMNKEKM